MADHKSQLGNLVTRTGVEAALVVVRADPAQYSRPYVWRSSQRVTDFFNLARIGTLEDLASRMEGFLSSGVEGQHLHLTSRRRGS